MVDRVEMPVECNSSGRTPRQRPLGIRMLGPLAISRNDVTLVLPASRKVRGLIAYLSLAPHAVTRSQLCELLWDVPNDPRGELRWCLSKIRGLLDDPDRRRVDARADTVGLDLTDCCVDVIEIAQTVHDVATVDLERLRKLAALFAGDFLEGLEIDRSAMFNSWVTAQRRRFRGFHVAVLEQLGKRAPEKEAQEYLEKWLGLAPFDQHVHDLLLNAFARQGRIREGEEHLAATIRWFESEGLDSRPIFDAWRSARARGERKPLVQPAASVTIAEPIARPADAAEIVPRRASIAVMPFVARSAAAEFRGGAADGLADDIITRLAKLRGVFVIARGSVFALHERGVGPADAARMLNVDYVASGSVRLQAKRLTVTIELVETRTSRIIWVEAFDRTLDDAFLVLDEIGNHIVVCIASEIEMNERNRAVLKPPNSLDAWEAHHRGLWHMYRFTRSDNEQAQHFFRMAIRLDPTFSRAYAGASFTHFQNVFQGWAAREPEADLAFETAERSLMADDRDPAAHWAMGRALWLRGRQEQSIVELERAVDLSPNFALAHYMLAMVHAVAGDPSAAILASDHSRYLSPFDPLLFGPLGARTIALVRSQRFEEAADWGLKAAAHPNPSAHSMTVAAISLGLADRLDEARAWLALVQKTHGRYGIDDFLTAMRLDFQGIKWFREGAKRIGMK